MKKTIALLIYSFFAAFSMRADIVLFSDNLNYPDGCIETDGLWYCYSPASPDQDAFVIGDLLILNSTNHDAVAAPTNGFSNPESPDVVYASFTINVSQLPSVNGSYFVELMDNTNNNAAHIFIDTKGTAVPGTYRLGIANYATSITAFGATNFPMDLATGVTYQVVINWDEVNGLGANLWINPSSESDQYVYGNDTTNVTYLQTLPVTQIGFSQYGGVQAIGNVIIGTGFSDVMTNVAQLPVIGVQPQGATNYSGNNLTLYTAASGMDVTYQWLSNNVPMFDDGVTIVGSTSNILNLTNLQASANYSVVATDSAGSVTSDVAQVSIITTPTPPFFTLQPVGGTNSLLSSVTLSAAASGTGPITYQWYFEPADGGSFSTIPSATSSSYTFSGTYGSSGSYYVTATGDGSSNSTTVVVTIIPPPLTPISYLHTYLTNYNGNSGNLNNGQIFNVEGIVTSIGQIESATTPEFFLQDASGGCLVYGGGLNISNLPPAGALVHVISPAESYYGEVEMDPTAGAATNLIAILSTNNPLPAPIPLNIPLIATNNVVLNPYGSNIECSLVCLTNVYLYSSRTGAAETSNFPTNKSIGIYAFQQPYYANEPYVELFVYTYTNALNLINTNYFGKPIPSFAYEITAPLGVFNPTTPEPYPTRYVDFVTTLPASFSASLTMTNGTPTLAWPAVVGSTYSVYSATNITGPWTQTFGLSYYPSTGIYTPTNAAATQFYKVSSP
jgi:hypothetical protein